MDINQGNKTIYVFLGNSIRRFKHNQIPEYHKDWNKLMQVVEKIEQGNYGIKQCRKVVEVYYDDTKEIILKVKEANRLASLWSAVIDFIQWYNNTKAPQP